MMRRATWASLAAIVLVAGCRRGTPAPVATAGSPDPARDAGVCEKRQVSPDGRPCCTPGGVVGEIPGTTCDACVGAGLTCRGCPGERPGVTCYPPQPTGGAYGRCIEDGEEIEGKVLGAYCCNRGGASSRGTTIPSQGPAAVGTPGADVRGCLQRAPVSVQICARCGDGICAPWENPCNCPADCSPSPPR